MLSDETSFEWHALPFGQAGMKHCYIFHISKGINTVKFAENLFYTLAHIKFRCALLKYSRDEVVKENKVH